jgi:sugar lactone lactonase YvrE
MRALNGVAFGLMLAFSFVVLFVGVAWASHGVERLFEPEDAGSGAKLLAIDPPGKLLYVRPSSDATAIEAIDADHGKVRARYETLAPATCACVDERATWLLAGDAEGRVFRWDLKSGERVSVVTLPGVAGKPRPVRAILAERRGGVYVVGGDLVLMLSKNVFGARFLPETDARAVFYKPGQAVEVFNEREDLAITNSGDGSYHGYQISKDKELWVLDLGYTETTFISVERDDVFFEGRDTLRLFDARKGKTTDEDDEVKPLLGVAEREGGRVYVGTHSEHVVAYAIEAGGKLKRAQVWGALDAAITGMCLDAREAHLYVSDTTGTLYKIRVAADGETGQTD